MTSRRLGGPCVLGTLGDRACLEAETATRCIQWSGRWARQPLTWTALFLKRGEPVITLHRDERKQRVMIRFTAANQALEVRRGCLGIAWNEGGARGITAATETIINEFFSPRLSPPRLSGGRTKAVVECAIDDAHKVDARDFCHRVELINVDAAPDELLSADMGRTSGLTPRARLVARDKSHGARRTGEGEGGGIWCFHPRPTM